MQSFIVCAERYKKEEGSNVLHRCHSCSLENMLLLQRLMLLQPYRTLTGIHSCRITFHSELQRIIICNKAIFADIQKFFECCEMTK